MCSLDRPLISLLLFIVYINHFFFFLPLHFVARKFSAPHEFQFTALVARKFSAHPTKSSTNTIILQEREKAVYIAYIYPEHIAHTTKTTVHTCSCIQYLTITITSYLNHSTTHFPVSMDIFPVNPGSIVWLGRSSLNRWDYP